MDNLELEQQAEAWVRAVKKAEEKIKAEELIKKKKRGGIRTIALVPSLDKLMTDRFKLISDELASFLGKTNGTIMTYPEIHRDINSYIRANGLQDKTNGMRINADIKLSSLLKLKAGEELTYSNLQIYLRQHYSNTLTPDLRKRVTPKKK